MPSSFSPVLQVTNPLVPTARPVFKAPANPYPVGFDQQGHPLYRLDGNPLDRIREINMQPPEVNNTWNREAGRQFQANVQRNMEEAVIEKTIE